MHELSLIHSILGIIEDYAGRHAFTRVSSLTLSFGKLSGIDPQALNFAFGVEAMGTRAESANLTMNICPIVIYCFNCEKDITISSYISVCPDCQGEDVIMTGGTEELKLIDMDVD